MSYVEAPVRPVVPTEGHRQEGGVAAVAGRYRHERAGNVHPPRTGRRTVAPVPRADVGDCGAGVEGTLSTVGARDRLGGASADLLCSAIHGAAGHFAHLDR